MRDAVVRGGGRLVFFFFFFFWGGGGVGGFGGGCEVGGCVGCGGGRGGGRGSGGGGGVVFFFFFFFFWGGGGFGVFRVGFFGRRRRGDPVDGWMDGWMVCFGAGGVFREFILWCWGRVMLFGFIDLGTRHHGAFRDLSAYTRHGAPIEFASHVLSENAKYRHPNGLQKVGCPILLSSFHPNRVQRV